MVYQNPRIVNIQTKFHFTVPKSCLPFHCTFQLLSFLFVSFINLCVLSAFFSIHFPDPFLWFPSFSNQFFSSSFCACHILKFLLPNINRIEKMHEYFKYFAILASSNCTLTTDFLTLFFL